MRDVQNWLKIQKNKTLQWLSSSHALATKIAHSLGHQDEQERKTQAQHFLACANDVHSLQDFLPYDIYDPETHIFINRHSLGWGLSFNPATHSDEEFVQILASILTDVLPTGSDLQLLLWASPKIGHGLQQALDNVSKRGGEFAKLAQIQVEYLKKGAANSLSRQGDFYLRDLRSYLFFSVPKKHCDANLDRLVQLRDDVQSTLGSINFHSQIVAVEHFQTFVSELISPNNSIDEVCQPWNAFDPIAQQITNSEQAVEVHGDGIIFKKPSSDVDGYENKQRQARCFSVKNFPKYMYQWNMNEAIGQLFNSALQVPCPYLISLNIRLLDSDKAGHKVQAKIIGNESKSKNNQILNWLPSLSREQNDWKYIRERLTEGDRLVHMYFQVILFDEPKKIARSERKLRDLYAANGWKLGKEMYLQLQSFLAAMPMLMSEGLYEDMKLFRRLKTMTAFNAVNIAPLQGEWKGLANPLVVLPGRRGQICWWNPFANQEGNYNVAVAANSGKGKSVFVQYYIASLLGSGGRCWVIDVGHSYEKTCRILGGEFIAFHIEKPICLNFFTHIHDEIGFKQYLPLLVPLVATMARQKTDTTEEEDKFIEKALSLAWQQKRNGATITTVKECLDSFRHTVADNLAHLLVSYAKGGMFADFFEGDCRINFDNPFIVLELLGLKDKKNLQRVVLFALIARIHQAMYLSPRNHYKSCIIDEAWDLLGDKSGNAAKFIETGYRTARRHEANFVSITQSINDYYQNDTAKAAFTNADFTVVLGQKPQDIDNLQRDDRFPVDGHIKRLLKSLKMVDQSYSECLIQSPSGMSVHRIVLAPYIRVLFSSKGREFEAVNQLQKQGHSLHEAVLKVSEQQGEAS